MANAIEMAIGSALKKAVDGLAERLPELLQNLPPDIKATIDLVGKSVACYQTQLDRIEARQLLIMTHFDIPDPFEKTELNNGRFGNAELSTTN